MGKRTGEKASDGAERKRTQKASRESEEFFRSLVENALNATVVVNSDGTIRYESPSIERVMGHRPEDRIGTNIFGSVHPEDVAEATDAFAQLMQNRGATLHKEIRAQHEDGSWRHIEVVGRNLLDDPVVEGVIASLRDITERKQMEKALQESEMKYSALVEQARDGVVIVQDGFVKYANKALTEIMGYPNEELVGMYFLDVLLPEYKDQTSSRYETYVEGEIPPSYNELKIRRKDGETKDIEASGTVIQYNGKPAVMGIARDITERKQAEEALGKYRERLEELVEERTKKLTEANEELKIRLAEGRQAERALRQSEEKYRDLADLLPQIVFEIDEKGNFTFTNRKGVKAFGYTQDDIKAGLNAFQALVPEDRDRVRGNMRRVLSGEKSSGNEYTALRKDGSTFPILIFSSPIIKDEKPLGLRGIVIDITERKQMEEALAESEKRFRSLIENALDVIVIIDGDGMIQYESPAIKSVLGHEPEDTIGQYGIGLVHPDDMADITREFTYVRQNPGATISTEVRVRHTDGSWLTLEAVGKNLLHDPAVAGIVVNFRDITDRKLAEEVLRDSEERFKAIAEAIPIPVVISHRSDGTVLYANEHVAALHGVPPKEMIGRKTLDFYNDPDDRQVVLDTLRREGLLGHYEFRFKKMDGTPFWAIVTVQPIVFEGKQAFLSGFYDITDRKQAEEELQKHYDQEKDLRQQLEAEMKRRVEFTRALAHELKTPLTSVLASSDLLVSELSDEPVLSLARNIRQGASNLNSTIDEFLDLARGEIGMLQLKYESVDLVQLLRETVASMATLASERGQSLVHALSPHLPTIQADGARLQQVVTNLLGNAVKFTPRGGKITLRAKESNGTIMVEVQDTGRGIPKGGQERLFEPYQRLRMDGESLSGLGLGLSLCKTLVELHGGQIWVKSRVGRGSTFGFSLPLRAASQQTKEPEKVGKLWKVLIIEDDREIVDSISLTFHLRWPEAELVSTGLGEEGIEMVEDEDPDIVILDLGLPDIGGFEALRQIRLFSSVPIIILSVKEDEADMVKGLEWGADDYVVKPFRQIELLARLKAQLRKQTPPDEEVPIICGSLRLEPSTFQLTHGGKEISLTIVEGRIIECLMRNAGHVVTHSRLAEAVWGEDYPGAIDSLRVYIRYLRQKLEADPSHPKLILTKAGIGYSLVKPV